MPEWGGQRYNEDWFPIGDWGEILGPKDWAANAAWAASTGGQNPYTNQPGSSPFDTSGLTPGNEAGSVLKPQPQAGTPKTATSVPSGPAPSAAPPPPPSPLETSVRTEIENHIKKPIGDFYNDPVYLAAQQANDIQSTRAAQRQRMSTAQRMHAQGQGDSGAMDSAVSRIEQQRGERDAVFNAGLQRDFLEADRDRVQNALQLGAGLISNDLELSLRQRLADLNATLAREDMNLRRDALNAQSALGLAGLDQQMLIQLLQGGW